METLSQTVAKSRWRDNGKPLAGEAYFGASLTFLQSFISTGLQPGEPRQNEPPAVSTAATLCEKPLKRLWSFSPATTGLKPGANGTRAKDCEKSRLGGQSDAVQAA
jgi:hypothetical protein